MFSGPSLVLRGSLVSACGALALGCAARAAPPVSSASTTSARVAQPKPVLLAAVRAETDDEDDEPRGTLVIGGDIMSACRSLGATKAPAGEENMTWLYLMKSIARCAKGGELGTRPIILRGPARPQVIVKYIFTKLGVPDERVVVTAASGERSCGADDECEPADLRVDIELGASDGGATL